MKKWVCTVCGYIHEGPEAPETCPRCKAPKAKFDELKPKKWVCSVCGYVHEGAEPPEKCPQCGAPKEKFREQGDSRDWAAEHVIGIGKDVDPEVVEGLRSNFMGECTEVGMYLAMSRAADREGYPEVAEAYKRIAFEEAEHAAKFAEMLGEVVSDSSKENLSVRLDAEFGATMGKVELAQRARELGYDAIAESVMEMGRDEARHGKAFEGLLKRYFQG